MSPGRALPASRASNRLGDVARRSVGGREVGVEPKGTIGGRAFESRLISFLSLLRRLILCQTRIPRSLLFRSAGCFDHLVRGPPCVNCLVAGRRALMHNVLAAMMICSRSRTQAASNCSHLLSALHSYPHAALLIFIAGRVVILRRIEWSYFES